MNELIYNKLALNKITCFYENKKYILGYSKHLIRNNNKSVVLDNTFIVESVIEKLHKTKQGNYLIFNKFLYTHKNYKSLKFFWINPCKNLIQKSDAFLDSFKLKKYIFFLKIIKGGIKCYGTGLKGTLFKKKIKIVLKFIKINKLNKKFYFFDFLKNKNKIFHIKLPINIKKISFFRKKSKIKKLKKYKRNVLKVNFTFPSKLSAYEKKKNKKKNRRYYFRKKN